MNPPAPSSALIEALQNSAMLSSVKVCTFNPHRVDKEAGKQSDSQQHARQGTSRLTVNMLTGVDALHRAALKVANDCRLTWHDLTGAWNTDGIRLLPNTNMPRMVKVVRDAQEALNSLREQMSRELPALLAQAQANLGDHAQRVVLPSAKDIIDAYSLDAEYTPIPDGSGFKGLSTGMQNAFEIHVQKRVAAGYVTVLQDTMNRVKSVLLDEDDGLLGKLDRFEDRKAIQDGGGNPGRNGIFRDSAILAVRDLARALQPLNIMNDPTVSKVFEHINDIVQFEPDQLRESNAVRDAVREKIGHISDLLTPIPPTV